MTTSLGATTITLPRARIDDAHEEAERIVTARLAGLADLTDEINAQAEALRGLKQTVWAKKLEDPSERTRFARVRADELRREHIVVVEAGEYIPADGEVIRGAVNSFTRFTRK